LGCECVLCVGQFGVFGGVSVCCVWESLAGFERVILCGVEDSLRRVWGSDFVLSVGQFGWVWGSEFMLCGGEFAAGLVV